LRAREAFGGGSELVQVEALDGVLALREVDAKDVGADFRGRQVHEEDLVEAALAKQLRRKRSDVVRGGDEEYAVATLAHPREERAQQAPRDTAVAARVSGGHALLDLVQPQDARHHLRRGL